MADTGAQAAVFDAVDGEDENTEPGALKTTPNAAGVYDGYGQAPNGAGSYNGNGQARNGSAAPNGYGQAYGRDHEMAMARQVAVPPPTRQFREIRGERTPPMPQYRGLALGDGSMMQAQADAAYHARQREYEQHLQRWLQARGGSGALDGAGAPVEPSPRNAAVVPNRALNLTERSVQLVFSPTLNANERPAAPNRQW
eukprot:1328417-Rhodomonas_salina.1